MAALTAEDILQKLKQNQYAPVYFLQGEEPYYIDLISDHIEKHALNDADKGFNQVVMYGKDTDVLTILSQAKRYPMMAERSVVIVKEAQSIQDIEKENGMKALEAYLKNPLPSTVLVFAYKHKTLDGRKSLAKTMNQHAVLLTTKKLYDNQIPAWISNYIKSKNLQVAPKAVQMLAEYIGADLSRLANEIDKLTINLKPGQTIDEKLVQENIGISKDFNIFELQTALINQDVMKANRIVNYFEANPKANPVIPNLNLLFSFFSKILTAHALEDKSDSGLAKGLGVSPYFAKDYQNAIRTYSFPRTIQIIHFIRVADLQSKGIEGGNMKDGDILRELVFKILHPVPQVLAVS
jgi:DNA polymerase-3 subunit delta